MAGELPSMENSMRAASCNYRITEKEAGFHKIEIGKGWYLLFGSNYLYFPGLKGITWAYKPWTGLR
jgi:hypothetical protein